MTHSKAQPKAVGIGLQPARTAARLYQHPVLERLDEVNPLPLIGRRQAAAAAATDDTRAGDFDAGVGARPQHRATFERAHRLATQQAGQLDPFGALDPRTSLDKFGRHRTSPYRPPASLAVRHLPTVPRTLVPDPTRNSLVG